MELMGRDGKSHTLEIKPIVGIPLNIGCGYGADPDWTHGLWKGDDWIEGSVYDYNDPAVSGRGAFSIVDHIAPRRSTVRSDGASSSTATSASTNRRASATCCRSHPEDSQDPTRSA